MNVRDMTVTTESWWPSLHDADVVRFTSDLNARTATLDVVIEHLGDESGHGASFSLIFQVVHALSAARWQPWGPSDRELSDPELKERRTWGRMVSHEVSDFEGPFLRIDAATRQTSLAADLIWPAVVCPPETPVQLLTLVIEGIVNAVSVDLAIAFERIDVLRDGEPISVEKFVRLGEEYWERWNARSRSSHQP